MPLFYTVNIMLMTNAALTPLFYTVNIIIGRKSGINVTVLQT